jgi:hypothetical protein
MTNAEPAFSPLAQVQVKFKRVTPVIALTSSRFSLSSVPLLSFRYND